MACLCSINICYDVFVSYEFFEFFWNMFNSKAIKIYYYDSHINVSSEFLLIHTHQDL